MNGIKPNRVFLLVLSLLGTLLPLRGFAQPGHHTAVSKPKLGYSQAGAFDFILGAWAVSNHFLVKRLQHSHQWIDFESTTLESALPTGTGNTEIYRTNHWPDFVGMAERLYNPQTGQWSIYWTDNRFSRGMLQPPVTGTFKDGLGVFEGKDSFNGTSIIVRYTWRSIDHDHAHWTQAFSTDEGRSWETNWIMEFTRANGSGSQATNTSG